MVREWTRASEESLNTAAAITLPFHETGYFPPDEAMAAAYRMQLRRGRRLSVVVTFVSSLPSRLFVDLFEVADPSPRRVASLDEKAMTLVYNVPRDGEYILRVQPELLGGGRFTLVERTLASLSFPVSGLTATAVQSGFGSARDAGTRAHEGIDIFATRGTPVRAVVQGVATPGTNALGGNVVWLRGSGGLRFYYAHLDRQALDGVTSVHEGDVLGYVGNTGNARTTGPHLHFGVYDGGAIDPLPFLGVDDPVPEAPPADVDLFDQLMRVMPTRAPLHAGPNPGTTIRTSTTRGGVVRIFGASGRWVRVQLPDGTVGYLPASATTPIEPPLRRDRLGHDTPLRERPGAASPIVAVADEGSFVDVLGLFGDYELLRDAEGHIGWRTRMAPSALRVPSP
jgi:hypothetical protein